jgi:predicted transposase/invertase (TIGR01784 family)
MTANREYKDSVFSLYLSDPERLIDVYNAVAKTNYPPDTPVEINTLTDVLYKNQINDLSFVLDDQVVVLIEHQSTINKNMALRLYMYSARVYEKITKQKPLYKRKQVKIPVPQFIVLYNGNEPFPEHEVQKLSDSFIVEQENPQLELKVDIYNINYEVNAEIVQNSKSLNEYSHFIGKIKENLANDMNLEEAIKDAIEYGINHDIMKEFLEANGTEVANMLLSGWNMDEALIVSKEEGFEDGFEAGFAGGKAEGAAEERKEMIRKFSKINTPEQIAEILHVTKEYVLEVLSADGTMYASEPTKEYNIRK